MGHVINIGRYSIVDANLERSQSNTKVSIPCNTNPGLSYQLDGWDTHTTVPAFIDGNPVNLAISHYDQQHDSWILNSAT